MKKMTFKQFEEVVTKRAALFREWILATYANNEEYYFFTLYDGIPDGDTEEIVLYDLGEGFYDESLDEMLAVYERAKKKYGKDGYYYGGKVLNEDVFIDNWFDKKDEKWLADFISTISKLTEEN